MGNRSLGGFLYRVAKLSRRPIRVSSRESQYQDRVWGEILQHNYCYEDRRGDTADDLNPAFPIVRNIA